MALSTLSPSRDELVTGLLLFGCKPEDFLGEPSASVSTTSSRYIRWDTDWGVFEQWHADRRRELRWFPTGCTRPESYQGLTVYYGDAEVVRMNFSSVEKDFGCSHRLTYDTAAHETREYLNDQPRLWGLEDHGVSCEVDEFPERTNKMKDLLPPQVERALRLVTR